MNDRDGIPYVSDTPPTLADALWTAICEMDLMLSDLQDACGRSSRQWRRAFVAKGNALRILRFHQQET